MNSTLLVVSVICAFAALQFVNGDEDVPVPSFEVTDGDCATPNRTQLVRQEHIKDIGVPFVVRHAKFDWYGNGNKKITCLKVTSSLDPSEQSTVTVTAGGAGHFFVTLEMQSKRGHGIDYDIEIYAKDDKQ